MKSLSRTAPFQTALEGTPDPRLRDADFVSIIVPTLNEVGNIDDLLAAIFAEGGDDLKFEVLVADGGSTDGTIEKVRNWEVAANVRLISCDGRRGLAGDVLTAAATAKAEVVVVMDADLSHPPSVIHSLAQSVLDGTSDMVVGSRFVPGGSTPDWPLRRRVLSRLGALLAWPLTEIKDPMSGFFAVRRERLLAVDPDAAGFKIGLEVIAHGGGALRVSEVPITFSDRVTGASKIGKTQLVAYLHRLLVLASGAVSASGVARFASVGLVSLLVDLVVFGSLFALGVGVLTAHLASFCIAAATSFCLNSRWTFSESSAAGRERSSAPHIRFLTVCLLALAVRGGALAGAQAGLGMPPEAAILYAIGAGAIVNYLGTAFFVFPSLNPHVPLDIRWRIAAIGVVIYGAVLRLLFLGLVDLWPQEAYYRNYAQHLDIGYLDHPPMVAWLIWAGTGLIGDNEFGVRIAAWLAWFATAFFSFRLTHRLFGKSAAFVSVLLVAALPFYFATGFLMTPDASLVAAWAGALYFLERALIGEQRNAWWGVGVCIGLGMLSKYSIALLALATVLFVLFDTRARIWLTRPQPYLAAIVALIIFSPVVIWNLENGFASFAFQSLRRIESEFSFSLPTIITNAAVLVTPTGLIAAFLALSLHYRALAAEATSEHMRRVSRFVLIFALIPLVVFIAFSLSRDVKLNWTGPIWLAALPAISAAIVSIAGRSSAGDLRMRRLWVPTIASSLVLYGLALNYLVMGIPGLGYAVDLPSAPVAWREFGREASALEREVERATGIQPMMIGLDTYNIASQLAFYGPADSDGMAASVGRGVLGRKSLMYGYWYDAELMRGRPAVMIAFRHSQIADPTLAKHFANLSDPAERRILKDGKPAGRFYYRIGYDFLGPSPRVPPRYDNHLVGARPHQSDSTRAGRGGEDKGKR